MQVNRVQSNNYNCQPNFKGFVGPSMKKYVSSQMEKELTHLYVKDKKYGPFANTSLIENRVKALHSQVQSKLSRFMETLNPNVSMEYEAGVVKLQNNDSRKTLSFVSKDLAKPVTGEIYGDKIDMFSPIHIPNAGEITLHYIDSFASILEKNSKDKIGKINNKLGK